MDIRFRESPREQQQGYTVEVRDRKVKNKMGAAFHSFSHELALHPDHSLTHCITVLYPNQPYILCQVMILIINNNWTGLW